MGGGDLLGRVVREGDLQHETGTTRSQKQSANIYDPLAKGSIFWHVMIGCQCLLRTTSDLVSPSFPLAPAPGRHLGRLNHTSRRDRRNGTPCNC